MADPQDDDRLLWFSPDPRGVIPLDNFHVPRSVRRLLRDGLFVTTTDIEFERIMHGCARRPETWISKEMISLYTAMHRDGYAHSIEVWQGDQVVGGLYGMSIGGAFFGESMYSDVSNASKVALVDLVLRLKMGRFQLLDTQYLTPHLVQFGGIEVARVDFLGQLATAIAVDSSWFSGPGPLSIQEEEE